MRKLLLFLASLICWATLFSQSETLYKAGHKIEHYQLKDGVLNPIITNILEDSKGYMWFTNWEYLLKYDGYEMKQYKLGKDQQLETPAANMLIRMKEDKDGYIWIFCNLDGALVRFNPQTETFTRIRNEEGKAEQPLINNHGLDADMVLDTAGHLWMGGTNGLHKITTNGDQVKVDKYQRTGITEGFKNYMDSILLNQAVSLAAITQVPDAQKRKKTLKLSQTTQLLLLTVGELGPVDTLYDYGWMADETGTKIWSSETGNHSNAGGYFDRNFIQLDTLTLAAGNYTLYYKTNEKHAYNNWADCGCVPTDYNSTAPMVKDWWGIQVLDAQQLAVTAIYDQFSVTHIKQIAASINAYPFIGNDGGLFLLTREGIFKIELDEAGDPILEKRQKGLLGNTSIGIHTGPSGITWIPALFISPTNETTLSLYAFDAAKNQLKEIKHGITANANARSVGAITAIEEDEEGNLWLATLDDGLVKLAPPFYEITDTLHTENAQYIPLEEVNKKAKGTYKPPIAALKRDKKDNLWVGTMFMELFKIELQKQDIDYVNIRKELGLTNEVQFSHIMEDKADNLWIAVVTPGVDNSLIKYNKISHEWKHYEQASSPNKANLAFPLIQDEPHTLWVTGRNELLKFNTETEQIKRFPLPQESGSYIYKMLEDEQGNFWINTWGGGLFYFEKKTQTFTTVIKEGGNSHQLANRIDVTDIIKDKEQGIWASITNGYGPFLHLAYQQKKVDTLAIAKLPVPMELSNIEQDNAGNLWAASWEGLLYFDIKNDTIARYSREEGLTNERVLDLEIDDAGDVWAYTALGLSKFDLKSKRFITYRRLEDFVPSHNTGARTLIHKNQQGQFYVLEEDGFFTFTPEKLQKSQIAPTVIISDIQAANISIVSKPSPSSRFANKEFSLSYSQNDLSIDYIGIHYDDATKQRYQYQLEGVDKDWVTAGKENTARYPNLSPNNYTFKVKAANADGIWSEPISVKIIINPPWWQTWWAYALYVLAGVGVLLWYIRSMNEKLQKEQAYSNKLASINAANQRFVPKDFLQILGKGSIEDLQLGDQVATKMTVLFSDIRDYTPLSETMTPEQNFKFINAYLGRIGPIIKQHGGFISSYLGDGLMALFVNEPENAIAAMVAMQKELDNYNRERQMKGLSSIKTGMGLNTGGLMLGVIGDEHRYESTVISDAVNTASRMEGLTKVFGAAIILSERTMLGLHVSDTSKVSDTLSNHQRKVSDTLKARLPNGQVSDTFAYRYLGKVKVKGKDKAIKIYDLYEGETVTVRELKAQTKLQFEQGIDHYFSRQFGKAAESFKQVLAVHEGDKAAVYYLDKSVGNIVNGVAEDWSGVEEMAMK